MKTKQAQAYRFVRFVLSAFCLMIMLVPLPSYGADTGTVKGKITDKADGEGVFGASVIVAGTTIGTATDMNGNYTLQNVPAKPQKISISIVGYSPASQIVTVATGQTAVVNLQIGQTTVMASEVVVGASLYKQDRLDVPVTANVVSQEKIRQEPSATLDKALEEVPGVNINRSAGNSTSAVQIRGSNTYQGGGIGTRVQGLYDGFPINTPESGEIVWTNINMNAADKVEILKGAAATLYGSGAMGGVVNVFGHLPDKFEVKAGLSGGFYDATPSSDQSDYRKPAGTNSVAVGTPWLWNSYIGLGNKSGKLNYNLLYTHSTDDGYRQNTQMELNDVKLKARYDIDAKQYLQLSAFYNETNGGYASTWPYEIVSLTQTGAVYNPHPERAYDVANSVYADDAIKRKNALIGLNYVNLLSDKLSLDTRLYYTHNATRIDYNPTSTEQKFLTDAMVLGNASFQATALATANMLVARGVPQAIWAASPGLQAAFGGVYMAYQGAFVAQTINDFNNSLIGFPYDRLPGEYNETRSNRFGGGFKFDWRATDKHRLLFGLDANTTNVESTQYITVVKPTPVPGALNPFDSIQEKNFAAFIQDEWKLTDKLTALLSARYDWSGIDADQVTYLNYIATGFPSVTKNIENSSVDALSPRIALNYKATDNMSFRTSFGKSFRAPTLAERFVRDAGLFVGVPNPALDKETMTAYEAGVYKQFSDKISLDVAAYLNDYENLIESRNINPTGWPIIFQYKNIAKARIWGIETNLNIRPNTDWNFNIGYAYMNAQNKTNDAASALAGSQNPDPKWLQYRPEHTASAGATWKPVNKLSLNLNGRYVSKYKAVSSYPNPQGTNYPGGFIVLNTGVKYQAGENTILSLLCRNIGNVQYEEAEWFRAPGRSYIAGVDFTF
jgi:iron complex outermembrane receptor protein